MNDGKRFPAASSIRAPIALLVCLLCVDAAGGAVPRANSRAVAADAARHVEIKAVRIRDDVYLLTGAGANIVVQVGPQGALVVDSGKAANAEQVLAAIRKLTPDPIRYVFDTGADPDHAGGNAVLAKAGRAFGQNLSGPFAAPGMAVVVAAQPAAVRLGQETEDSDGWPTHTVSRRSVFYLNGQGVEVLAMPAAHSDADAVVLFRRSDVLVSGEIFDVTRFPVIDTARGGTIQGEIDALNDLIDMAIPNVPLTWLDGGTLVVPANGPVCQQAELVQYRDMVTIIRDRVRSLKSKGGTLRQVLDADPAAGYIERYGKGASGGASAFVEAIYKTLPAAEQAS